MLNKGHEGDDRIRGGEGDDELYGWKGNDRIFGEGGDDYISGYWGDDILSGAAGDDVLKGHEGNDRIFGGEGDDLLYGWKGDDIMNGIIAERLAEADIVEHGVLLDGFPRTVGQAEALEEILASQDVELDAVVNIDVPLEEVTARMINRGREDDNEEAIAERLRNYEEQTAPLLSFYAERNKLVVVDGLGEEDEVFARVQGALKL